MSKDQDSLAPTSYADEQPKAIRRMPRIIYLRKERPRLKNETQPLARAVQAAAGPYPELYQQHDEVCRTLTRVRKVLRHEAKKKGREECYDSMPKIGVDKHIDQLLDRQDQDLSDEEGAGEDWNPYVFPEWARIVAAFYRPEPETLEDDLGRIIYVTMDLMALCGLSAPSLRGKRCN